MRHTKFTEPMKIIVVVGPTASGKSELAVEIAKRFNGEIVSADSRQVYRGMDIGTGKVPRDTNSKPEALNSKHRTKNHPYYYKGVRHHLIDVASPKRTFTVARYVTLAQRAITDIVRRGKLPVVCGGTGFYVDALLGKVVISNIPPNRKIRKILEKRETDYLYEKLKELNPARAGNIDSKNRRRLIRALEIALLSAKEPQPRYYTLLPRSWKKCIVLKIGIRRTPEEQNKRIAKRLHGRMRQGLIQEVQRLHSEGVSWRRLDSFGLEYRFVSRYLRGILTKRAMITTLEKEICRYAKRQMTWFGRDPEILWVVPPKDYLSSIIFDFLERP